MQGSWAKTAASGFRMTAGTTPGRYGLPLGNRDRPTLYPPAACGCLSQGLGLLCGGEGDLICARHPGALPPHSATRVAHPGGGWIEPQPLPCSTMGRP